MQLMRLTLAIGRLGHGNALPFNWELEVDVHLDLNLDFVISCDMERYLFDDGANDAGCGN